MSELSNKSIQKEIKIRKKVDDNAKIVKKKSNKCKCGNKI